MKRFALLVAFLTGFAGAAFAEPVIGTWATAPDDNGNYGHVEISACGEKICGVLVRAFNGDGEQIESDNIGRRIVWDMVAQGEGQYRRGRVYAPDRDKTYRSKMDLAGDALDVSGCILGGVICRAARWTRVE